MVSETTQIEQIYRFDESALSEVYDRFSDALYRYAMRLLGDRDMAEECVSETFSRLLAALRNGNGPREHLQAYLYRIAHNWITDSYRRQPPPSMPLDAEIIPGGDEHNPVRIADQNLETERVRTALHLLTPEQRQVIALRFLEDLSLNEVAQIMDRPVGAIKALQHRALASLKRLLLVEEEKLA